jgi:hypothetical protein
MFGTDYWPYTGSISVQPGQHISGPMHCRHSLPRTMPTVDPQIATSHKATGIAYEEYRCSSELLRLAQLTQHVLRWPITLPLRILLEQSFHHRGDDVSGRKSIDADTMDAPFGC